MPPHEQGVAKSGVLFTSLTGRHRCGTPLGVARSEDRRVSGQMLCKLERSFWFHRILVVCFSTAREEDGIRKKNGVWEEGTAPLSPRSCRHDSIHQW